MSDHIGESNKMKERPIIFSGAMVTAILDGRKTQTRRIVKGKWIPLVEEVLRVNGKWVFDTLEYDLTTPYGYLGDRLWVRETWRVSESSCNDYSPSKDDVHYRADPDEASGGPWKSPLFMPRWASRLTLEITDVRVQRLQEITEEDAASEGAEKISWEDFQCGSAAELENRENGYIPESYYTIGFEKIWASIHGKNDWGLNPWVWAITFRLVK